MNRLWRYILGLLYPFDMRCSLCQNEHDMGQGLGICAPCEQKLYRFGMAEDIGGAECYSMLEYESAAREMVVALKFNGRRHYARTLGTLAAGSIMQLGWQADAIVPVPIHDKRRKQRGYNQSGLIAQTVSELTGIPLMPQLVRRVKETLPQTDLERQDRVDNVKGAFHAYNVDGYCILLLDDVLTTGSTMAECAKALTMAGARCKCFAITRA